MIVTHRKVDSSARKEIKMEEQKTGSKVLEVSNQSGICDEHCMFTASNDSILRDAETEETPDLMTTIRCTLLDKDVEYKKCCIECPMIDKETYEAQIIERYNYNHAPQNSEEDIESMKVNAAMDAFKDVESVVTKMLDDKVIDKATADTLIWGALLECHNINKDLMPQNTVYQIYGIWASRQFRK